MSAMDSRIIALFKRVIAWLVDGDFFAAESRSGGVRLSADMMRQAVEEYGRTLVMPTDNAFADADVIRVTNADDPTWSVRLNLWTKEEGRSDLSIESPVALLDQYCFL